MVKDSDLVQLEQTVLRKHVGDGIGEILVGCMHATRSFRKHPTIELEEVS